MPNPEKVLPEAWKGMSPAEAGYNAIRKIFLGIKADDFIRIVYL
ncbi:MAG: hypothetical protein QG657_3178 [Acidobacteriota bacterium]|nr:hypothetical protein [Acidobacteriota bacterium]